MITHTLSELLIRTDAVREQHHAQPGALRCAARAMLDEDEVLQGLDHDVQHIVIEEYIGYLLEEA